MKLRFYYFLLLNFVFLGACSSDKEEKKNLVQVKAIKPSDFVEAGSVDEVELGRLLFFDKVLSGNQNISCATCHHPSHGTSDGLALGVGEGGEGLGPLRSFGSGSTLVHERVPRNSPALFNLGAKEFQKLFYDGRVHRNTQYPSGFYNPAKKQLPMGLKNILAVQALFPMTSPTEMAGQGVENPIAPLAESENFPLLWQNIVQRIQQIPEYVKLFQKTYSHIQTAEQIRIVDIGNAIAAFEIHAFTAINSPYDRFLKGEKGALTEAQIRGKEIFNGKANCVSCHSGALQTDHKFYAVGFPQIGPGKGDGYQKREDYGLEKTTKESKDRYKFKTPSLRNVELTAPYGHGGTFLSLYEVVNYHLNPAKYISSYKADDAFMNYRADFFNIDFAVMSNPLIRQNILQRNEYAGADLKESEVNDLVEFLKSLTDPRSRDMSDLIPESVPSGLPVED